MKHLIQSLFSSLLILVMASCAAPAVAPTTESASDAAAADATFPVSIDHKYGDTTIDAQPQRIVTVGLTDHDALLALGIVPVGTTEWFGGYEGAIWPWAQDELAALGGAIPEPVGGESINFEAIAALNPDLILALFSGVTEDEYALLSEIAPTVAQPGEHTDWGIPWQELTLTVGKAVGQAAEAVALVAEINGLFAQVRDENPQFQDAVSVVAAPYQGLWIFGPEDIRSRLLTDLGFSLPEGIDEAIGDGFGATVSQEKADMIDIDVVVWLTDAVQALEAGGPVYESLSVHTENREVFLPDEEALSGATSFVSVLGIPFLLDGLVPQLAEKVPSTAIDESSEAAADAAADAVAEAADRTTSQELTHELGTTTIEGVPERIVVLEYSFADNLGTLGVAPVGYAVDAMPDYLLAYTAKVGAAEVGTRAEPSLRRLPLSTQT